MRFLVLGGTSFVGRHIVEAALAGGHQVSLFNRGTTNAGLFPDCDHRRGDRYAGELDALKTGEWDAVVDVNAYIPRHVREAVDLLTGRVATYCFISTGSVYSDLGANSIDEDAPLGEIDDPTNEEITGETYGPLKVLCERAAEDFKGTTVVVRPGIVAGAHDPTGRFTYWVRRLARGGRVLGPAPPAPGARFPYGAPRVAGGGRVRAPPRADQPVQVVHGRDQGDFVVKL